MPEKRSSRRSALGKKSLRGWFFCRRKVLKAVIGVAKTLYFIWSIWDKFLSDLWPFYIWTTEQTDAT